MKLSDLPAALSPCGLHVLPTDESTLCDRSLAIITKFPNVAVRTIRGRKSRNVSSFFDESAAALQFPYYFGENWDAFDELIHELQWVLGEAFVFLFSNAELLLCDAPNDDFRILVETLSRVHALYATGPKLPFHAVFQCAAAKASESVSARLNTAGVTFDMIDAD